MSDRLAFWPTLKLSPDDNLAVVNQNLFIKTRTMLIDNDGDEIISTLRYLRGKVPLRARGKVVRSIRSQPVVSTDFKLIFFQDKLLEEFGGDNSELATHVYPRRAAWKPVKVKRFRTR
jgi:hypothetical protein